MGRCRMPFMQAMDGDEEASLQHVKIPGRGRDRLKQAQYDATVIEQG